MAGVVILVVGMVGVAARALNRLKRLKRGTCGAWHTAWLRRTGVS